MPDLAPFSKVAPYLVNPLVLVGFCIFLFFGIHWALLKAGLLTPLSQRQSSSVVRAILKYGFWVAILLIILGFAYAYSNANRNNGQRGPITQQAGTCVSNTVGDNNKGDVNCVDKGTSTKGK